MEKKLRLIIGTLVALGTAIVIFAGGLIFDLTTMWFSGHMDSESFQPLPIYQPWNQLDLLIIFVIGCGMTWLLETVCGLFVGAYLKKQHSKEHQ